MCYFAQTIFACGDWKWGNMMERCPRQHRIGETCGAKLVHPDHLSNASEACRICQEIGVKQRRVQKNNENIARWTPQGNQFAALLERARAENAQTKAKIEELNSRRPSIMHNKFSGPLTPQSGSSYTYSTSSRGTTSSTSPSSMVSGYSSQTAASARSAPPSRPEVRSSYYSPYSMQR